MQPEESVDFAGLVEAFVPRGARKQVATAASSIIISCTDRDKVWPFDGYMRPVSVLDACKTLRRCVVEP
jgi:hypothetical protein